MRRRWAAWSNLVSLALRPQVRRDPDGTPMSLPVNRAQESLKTAMGNPAQAHEIQSLKASGDLSAIGASIRNGTCFDGFVMKCMWSVASSIVLIDCDGLERRGGDSWLGAVFAAPLFARVGAGRQMIAPRASVYP